MRGLSMKTTSMRRSRAAVVLLLLVPALTVLSACSCGQSVKRIGVFQYGPDPDTESAYRGLLAGLEERGYTKGKNLQVDFRDCARSQAKIDAAARSFASAKLDAVVPLTTPCLVAAGKHVKNKPVVFTSVYNPVAAGVAESDSEHPPNLTGVYSPPPVNGTIDIITECVPGVAAIATAFNPDEANAESAVRAMREYCAAKGIALAELEVRRREDVKSALEGFLRGAARAGGSQTPQALYVTGDNTVMAAFDDVVSVTGGAGIPLFINDPGFVKKGALAGLGPDFTKAGLAGGRMLADVLDGGNPASIPLERNLDTLLEVNKTAAAALGISFPQPILDRAAEAE